jgi:uncharacterized protein (TIGR00288 family)
MARRFRALAKPIARNRELRDGTKLKIAVFVDFDNIETGVKSTLHREFDVAAVLDALKERGEVVTTFAYANWGKEASATRALSEHAAQMVQRDPSPRGDKNGADINLALDALEMAFTHDHINAFAIVSGDSDFIALVNKLKQCDKRVFVVGGRAFTSTILQKNCHEFVSYESIIDEPGTRPQQQHQQQKEPQHKRPQPGPQSRRVALDLDQVMLLVERALGVLDRREVQPQVGLLKSTMLQLDSTFNERAYGASSFTDFVEKLQKADLVEVLGGEGRYIIRMKGAPHAEKLSAKSEEAIPVLRDVIETQRLEYLGTEFHPLAPTPESAVATEIEEEYEPQPLVPGQPTATGEIPLPEPPPKPMRRPHARKPADVKGKKRKQRPRGGGRM